MDSYWWEYILAVDICSDVIVMSCWKVCGYCEILMALMSQSLWHQWNLSLTVYLKLGLPLNVLQFCRNQVIVWSSDMSCFLCVFTRFLRGTCKITDCPFSHKVAKEKMPVCSFFLRGVCNRDNCPYLHVNVSKSAELCQDFAKGYCALGDRVRLTPTCWI